jgi:hypothetical protein
MSSSIGSLRAESEAKSKTKKVRLTLCQSDDLGMKGS